MRFSSNQKKVICAVVAVAMIIPIIIAAVGVIAGF